MPPPKNAGDTVLPRSPREILGPGVPFIRDSCRGLTDAQRVYVYRVGLMVRSDRHPATSSLMASLARGRVPP